MPATVFCVFVLRSSFSAFCVFSPGFVRSFSTGITPTCRCIQLVLGCVLVSTYLVHACCLLRSAGSFHAWILLYLPLPAYLRRHITPLPSVLCCCAVCRFSPRRAVRHAICSTLSFCLRAAPRSALLRLYAAVAPFPLLRRVYHLPAAAFFCVSPGCYCAFAARLPVRSATHCPLFLPFCCVSPACLP